MLWQPKRGGGGVRVGVGSRVGVGGDEAWVRVNGGTGAVDRV